MTIREQIQLTLKGLTHSEKISILESLCKKYRMENSIRINARQMGRRMQDDDRPDLITLKSN